jgi:hypothetical protein
MNQQLLHIFRNTPLGRETLLQSIYFCRQLSASVDIYIPKTNAFLLYFENDVVQVDLDDSYLTAPETARAHVTELMEPSGLRFRFLEPKNYTASSLPDISTNFDFMCCPRGISDMSSKIGLGYIGPRVRRIVKSARFPVLIASPSFKAWNSISVFFGGSENAVNALRLGFRISRLSGMPLNVYTQDEKGTQNHCERVIEQENLTEEMEQYVQDWHVFTKGLFEDNLYAVPHDALVVLGAFGHGLIKNILFGSKMEKVQSTISNNLLIVGPNYRGTS